jgi:hypothetical protein
VHENLQTDKHNLPVIPEVRETWREANGSLKPLRIIYIYVSPVQMLLCALLVILALTHARAARVYLLDDGVEDQGKVSFQGLKNG